MSHLLSQEIQHDTLKVQKATIGLEFLSMCRTNKDVKVEYENSMELKKIRQAYITHVVDCVCQDRQRVFENDMKALAERDKDRVTLDNVFDIA
jgi:hypothetical protein